MGKTIESIQHQVFKGAYEIIVVGQNQNGYVNNDQRISFIETPDPVIPSTARNIGARVARGDILAFIDADCIASPIWLSKLVSEFNCPDIDVVAGGVQFDPKNYWTTSDNISMFHDYLATHKPGLRKLLPSINLAIRRDLFIRVGGFDETRPMSEDSVLSIRLRRLGHQLYFQPEAFVVHTPPRYNFWDMVAHHFRHGQWSIKVDPLYYDEPGIPKLFRTRLGVLVAAPVIAMGSTFSIFTTTPGVGPYWNTLPAVYLSKISWCLGAFCRCS